VHTAYGTARIVWLGAATHCRQSALSSATCYSQFLTEARRQLTLAFPVLDPDAHEQLIKPILTAITVPGSSPLHETHDGTLSIPDQVRVVRNTRC
jgi:hypothetical protein